MAITYPLPPPAALALVEQNVPVPTGHIFSLAPKRKISKPYPVYTGTIEGLLENQLLAMAQLTAWQYIVSRGPKIVGLAEVAKRMKPDDVLEYASFYGRQYTEWVVETIERARHLPQVQERNYELRLLRAPRLSLAAVWLKSADGDHLLLPLPPAPAGLEPGQVVREEQLLEALRPLAERRLARSDRGDEKGAG